MPGRRSTMQQRNTIVEALPTLIAGFFIVVPIVVLLALAREQERVPDTEYARDERVPAVDYARAVREAMRPDASYVSHSLVSVSLDQPVTVVTWMRRKQVADYDGKTAAPAYKNTWVTVVPKLKSFCQDYVKSHGSDPDQLNLRLQQRLGLPPNSNNDTFVTLTVDPKDISRLFRPCGDPSPDTNSCELASPPTPVEIKASLGKLDRGNTKEVEKYWLLSNYYWSF